MIGQTVSHYNIIEKLGQGGMGVVYKAEDTKLKRTVALKFLPPHTLQSDEEKTRFIREAQAAAALDHPNICTVYEINEADNQTFISIAYIEGEELKQKIKSGLMEIDEAVDIAIQIADGLRAAHEKDIVHRDIKSANIMVTTKGRAIIMDFGLAKLSTQTQLTRLGTTLGTIAYMSPEQGRVENVDHRSDIWSFGVVLYEMLSGKLPFEASYEQAVIYSIMNEEPEPLSTLRTDMPEELETIVKKAMTKNLTERYQSAEEMLNDLRAFRGGEVSKPTIIPKSESRQKNIRKPIIWSTTILLIVTIILAIIFFWPVSETSKAGASIAVLPFADMSQQRDQEYFCEGMTEELITKLSKIEEMKVIARTSIMRYKDSDKSIKEIGNALGVANILEGSIRKEGDNMRLAIKLIKVEDESHIWSEEYDKKLSGIFELQSEVAGAIAEVLQIKLTSNKILEFKAAQPKNVEAYEYYLKGMYQLNRRYVISESERALYNALDMFNKAIDIDSSYALSYVGLGAAYIHQFDASAYQNQEALALAKNNYVHALQLDPNSAEANTGISIIHSIEGDFDNAYQSLKTSMKLNPNNAETDFRSAMFLRNRGLFHQSIRFFSKAKDLNPFYMATYANLAQDLIFVGKYDQASILLKKAKEIEPEFVPIHSMEAQIAIITTKYDQAEVIISQAEKIQPGRIALEKALLYAARGEKEKALALSSHPVFFFVVGEVYALLGMKDEAIQEIIKANNQGRGYYYYLNLINSPLLRNLGGDPRFLKFVEEQKKKYEEYLQKYGGLIEE
jgi:serine/threonine protein kinase/Tfp pilus assembly protein PilF